MFRKKLDLCHNFGVLRAKYTKVGGTTSIHQLVLNTTDNFCTDTIVSHDSRAKLVSDIMHRQGTVKINNICELLVC